MIPAKTLLSAITGVTAPAATVLGLILVFASTFLGPVSSMWPKDFAK